MKNRRYPCDWAANAALSGINGASRCGHLGKRRDDPKFLKTQSEP
jgi:hypothetical protein